MYDMGHLVFLPCYVAWHLLYSCMLSSLTAWISLSWVIRAWTFIRPSRSVVSIFSIICWCLSIQYSQFSNTVSPTGCSMLVSSKTIRLAPMEWRRNIVEKCGNKGSMRNNAPSYYSLPPLTCLVGLPRRTSPHEITPSKTYYKSLSRWTHFPS